MLLRFGQEIQALLWKITVMSGTDPTSVTLSPISKVRVAVTKLAKENLRPNLTLFELQPRSAIAAVFTRNGFRAPPVLVAMDHLARSDPESKRFWLINSGNANAATGQAGIAAAKRCCQLVASYCGVDATAVLPFSTGVIGEPLDVTPYESAIPRVVEGLDVHHWAAAGDALRTTDTVIKGYSYHFEIGGRACTMTGIAKGSGMIRPDMATMLAFIATDATCSQAILQTSLEQAIKGSFNRITVDGDTSTNDACVCTATGGSGAPLIDTTESVEYATLLDVLKRMCHSLALALVRDAEGATKFVTVEVRQGGNSRESLKVAYAIAESVLVKTALFASDANWGRLVMAIGKAGLDELDTSRVQVSINGLKVVEAGQRAASYSEAAGSAVMRAATLDIVVELGRGSIIETVYTCDLSHGYISINADYRS